jgi:hypothetical protein
LSEFLELEKLCNHHALEESRKRSAHEVFDAEAKEAVEVIWGNPYLSDGEKQMLEHIYQNEVHKKKHAHVLRKLSTASAFKLQKKADAAIQRDDSRTEFGGEPLL